MTSNDLLAEVRHPNKSTGAACTSEKDITKYYATGDVGQFADRNGTLHHDYYDAVGRRIKDFSYPNGYQIDDAVRRLETAYDGQGNAFQFTSYDAHTGGNLVNQVRREFNGWGQMTREYQEHAGAVAVQECVEVRPTEAIAGGAPRGKVFYARHTLPNADPTRPRRGPPFRQR